MIVSHLLNQSKPQPQPQLEKNPRTLPCCLVCCLCLLYNKDFPSLSGGRDLPAGSAATATGSGLYWYLSLNSFITGPNSVCNVCFPESGSAVFPWSSLYAHTWSLLAWLQLWLDVYFIVYKVDSSVLFSCDETLCSGHCVFPLLVKSVKVDTDKTSCITNEVCIPALKYI